MQNSVDSYYIGGASDWILKYISDDIVKELQRRGYNASSGPFEGYGGEDISFQMWWRLAQPYTMAKHNSVFITHTDDKTKESDLIKMKDDFDSFICMSKEDAAFLIELGFDRHKVFGRTLPIRNSYIRPISIGVFSNCYSDHRKNESWLIEFCKTRTDANLINYVFMGNGWERVCAELSSCQCSFEWHCASRSMPGEYLFQQIKMSQWDYYLYMGMDGGAMGTYDAFAMGIPLCVSDDGYHKDLPYVERLFETKDELFNHLDDIITKQRNRHAFFDNNSIERYVDDLLSIWHGGSIIQNQSSSVSPANYNTIVEKRRANYFPLTFNRWRQPLSSIIHKFFNRRRLKK